MVPLIYVDGSVRYYANEVLEPVFNIVKSICPSTITENVAITDTFNPIMRDLAVSFNLVVWTEGVNYMYSETTGEFATVLVEITIPATG